MPLSRAATLPNISVDHSFEGKAKLRKSLAHISSRSLARSISRIEIENTQPKAAEAAAPVIPESIWVDILNNKLSVLSDLTNMTASDLETYQNSDDYLVSRQMDWLKRESLLLEWEAEEQREAKAGVEEAKRTNSDPRQIQREEAIRLYEKRWKDLIREEDIPGHEKFVWRGFSDLPWPSFDLPPQPDDLFPASGRPSITPLNFPITFESMWEFLLGPDRTQLRNRSMEELYLDEAYYWSMEAMDTRVLNKVRLEDSVAVLFALCAVNSWISGDIEGGNMYKTWLEQIAPMWQEERKKADEKEWEEILNTPPKFGLEGLL